MSWKYLKLIATILLTVMGATALSVTTAAPNIEGIQVYQKSAEASSERKQNIADDMDRYHNADNLWDILRTELNLSHYEDNPLVQEQIQWFMDHQDFLYRCATRAAPYLYFIHQQVLKRHLPSEVMLLPVFESAYNPYAYSTAGAAGIWQMMPNTASGLGIKQDWWYDGRRDVIASTKAALNHLVYLGNFFDGNWLLAIAAYDTGEGNVLAGIKRNIRDGESTDYWSLPLAQETRIYVPRLLALATIIGHPDQYPIHLPPIQNAPYLAQVDIGSQIDLKHAATLAGMSVKELQQLNPGYNHWATDPNGPYKLVVPIENVEQFTERLASSPQDRHILWKRYKVKPGDTFLAIAKRLNINPAQLRLANKLNSNSVKPGQSLLIPTSHKSITKMVLDDAPVFASSKHGLPNSSVAQKSSGLSGKLIHIVQEGETLWDIAKRYHTTAQHIAQDNHLKTSHAPLHEGDQLTISHAASPKATGTMHIVEVQPTMVNHNYSIQSGDTIYMSRPHDTLESIAKKFHTSTKTIQTVNNLHSIKIKPQQRLVIPTHFADIPKVIHVKPSHYAMQSGDTIYVIRHGDTLEKVAKKYRTSAAAIRVSNLLSSDTPLQIGARITIPAHIRQNPKV